MGCNLNKGDGHMLKLFEKQFNDIVQSTRGKRKTVLLSNLMSQMEQYYKLSAIKATFEAETDAAVKDLYVTIANARKL